jgi:uncharacterized lipoprotein YmbA
MMTATKTPPMHDCDRPARRGRGVGKRGFFFLLVLLVASGCGIGGKRTYIVKQYLLEYPAPPGEVAGRIHELLKVERFSVAQAFNTPAMIYKEKAFQYHVDPYHRWRVNPGDIVSDFLTRDLSRAGLFRAVYSHSDVADTRYRLEGWIEEFAGWGGKEGAKAVLSLEVTFVDLSKKEAPERVVFQKSYCYTEPLLEKTPEGLTRAMSSVMERLSKQIISDLYNALKNR